MHQYIPRLLTSSVHPKAMHRRLMALGSLLLLVFNVSNALDISIKIGDLAEVNTTMALGFMSGITMDKSIWWNLGSAKPYPEAFMRFIMLGAPRADVPPNASWNHQEEEDVNDKGRLLATRDASLVDSSSQKSIKQLGNLNMDAWMLGFLCVNWSLCDTVVPIAIVNRTNEAATSYCLEFTTVWDKLAIGNTVVANTITANLIHVSKEEVPIPVEAEDGMERFNFKVAVGMEPCTDTSMVVVRSSLEATYNTGPCACYRIDSSFKSITGNAYLLVLGRQDSNEPTKAENNPATATAYGGPDVNQNQVPSSPSYDTVVGKCVKDWLGKYNTVELAKCQHSPLLVRYVPAGQDMEQGFYAACPNSSSKACFKLPDPCEGFLPSAFHYNETDYEVMNVTGPYYIRGDSNYSLTTTGKLCEMASIDEGSFKQQDFSTDHDTNSRAVDMETLEMLFTGLKDRYAQAHSDAFQLQYGPSADFPSIAIALVAAAIAVLASTVPFTNLLLRLLINIFGSLHSSSSHRYKKMVLVFIVVFLVNEAIAIVCNSVVSGVIMSETQREEEFKTWALIAEPVLVNEKGLKLQALYVVQGKSTYKSQLLEFTWILGSIVTLLVGGITLYRCGDVFKKLKLIKEKEGSPTPLVDDYKALEMGRVEYIQLLALPLASVPISTPPANDPTSTTPTNDPSSTLPVNNPIDPLAPPSVATFKKLANFVLAMVAIRDASKYHRL